MKNICIVGIGPHAKRIYFKYFLNYNLMPKLIVELKSKKEEIETYLKQIGISDYKLLLLDDKYKDSNLLNSNFAKKLKKECDDLKISHAIISTEPKAHNAYINFFLDNKIPTLSDKPITVHKNMLSKKSIESIKDDYNKIVEKVEKTKTPLEIMCQRKFHQGYNYIKDLIKETVEKYNIPVTFCEVYHCDGKWMMPHDLDCENHPYKYGYGKLFHSGYHFIQLLSEIVNINKNLKDPTKKMVSAELSSRFISIEDELAQINFQDYKNLFKDQNVPDFYNHEEKSFKEYGEKNNYSLVSFKNAQNRTITVAELNLLQSGFSRRGWIETKADHYKGNGRIRHEFINIQIGTLMNIQVHSYQSKEIKDRTDFETEIGGLEHFDIYIFRNKDIIGGKEFEKLTLKDIAKNRNKFVGQNEQARETCLNKFLNGNTKIDDIKDHRLGIELLYNLSKAYREYAIKNVNKVQNFKLD